MFVLSVVYILARVYLSLGEPVAYGEHRRGFKWTQAPLPEGIIGDFEYFFVPNTKAEPVTSSDTGARAPAPKDWQPIPPSSSTTTAAAENEDATESKTGSEYNGLTTLRRTELAQYAGTTYTPGTSTTLSVRNESPGVGALLFSQSIRPTGKAPKAVLLYCHGFGDHTSWYLRDEAVQWAQRGFAVHLTDCRGNGRSDGLQNWIPSFETIVNDYCHVFDQIKKRYPPQTRFFLFGYSMGGAAAIHVSWKRPDLAKGAIFLAPMVKIMESVKPPEPVVKTLKMVASVWPTGPITPIPDLLLRCFRDPHMINVKLRDPIKVSIKTRLGSALQMIKVTEEFTGRLKEVVLPFMVIHGMSTLI